MFKWLKFNFLELGVRIFKPKWLGVFKMWKWFEGKKSTILAVAAAVANVAMAMGYIDKELIFAIDGVLASLFGVTIASKINRAKK